MKTLANLIVFSVSLSPLLAQWADRPTPGLPRTADGKPNLSAPTPRTPDGKPDLTGVWRIARRDVRHDCREVTRLSPAVQRDCCAS